MKIHEPFCGQDGQSQAVSGKLFQSGQYAYCDRKWLSLSLNCSSFTAPVGFARRMLGFYDAWKVWWRRGHGTGTSKLVSSCKISSHFSLQQTITGIRKCIPHAMRTTGVQQIAESHIILPGIQHEAIIDLEETHVNNSTRWQFCFCQNMGPQNVSVIFALPTICCTKWLILGCNYSLSCSGCAGSLIVLAKVNEICVQTSISVTHHISRSPADDRKCELQ